MRSLRDLLNREGHVHLVGVCGVGMAGVACLLRERVCSTRVTGCDTVLNPLADWLEGLGVRVTEGHDPAHVQGDVDWVIRSAAVPESSPEIQAAHARGIPVFKRGEVLPLLLSLL